MRTVGINVYEYEELSDSAKEKALHDYRSNGDYNGEENKDTLKAFEAIFPIKINDWCYGGDRNDGVKWEFIEEDEIEQLSGIRLSTYIYNNYFHNLFKGKLYYGTGYKKKRRSNIIFQNNGVLTGYTTDHSLLDPIYNFLKKPTKQTFHDLIEECLSEWVNDCTKDMEYYYSEEAFRESCEANEWEFYESGRMYY